MRGMPKRGRGFGTHGGFVSSALGALRRAPKQIRSSVSRAVNNPAVQAAAIAAASTAVNDYFSTPVKTKQSAPYYFTPAGGSKKQYKKKSYFASYGRHRGFIKGYRRMGRGTRKRYSKARSGMQVTTEQSGSVTDQRCAWVGHHTYPAEFVVKYAIYALVKKALNTGDIYFSSAGLSRAGNIADGDIFGFELRLSPLTATSAFSYTVIAADATFADVMEKVWVQFKDQVLRPNTVNFGAQSSFLKFYWNSAGKNKVLLNLMDASITVSTKSALKMQNRSINSVDDDEMTDVNNVPLHGKSYQFRGNTMIARDESAQNAIAGVMNPCDFFYGYTAFGASSVNSVAEPPESYFFMGSPKATSVTLQPGDIKTSVLTYNKRMNFSSFIRMLNGWYRITLAGDKMYTPIGPCRFFALERTIAPLAGEITPAISLAFENEHKLWVAVDCRNGNYTGPINLVQ